MVELDTYLFDPETIEQLDWNLIGDSITISKGFKIRPLKLNDYGRGYLKVISQLTDVGDVMREEFEERFKLLKQSQLVKVVVIEDLDKEQIAGSATVLCEPKFIHKCSWIGHVQDVVVAEDYRGKGFGKLLVGCLKLLTMHLGAYKMDLNCADDKIKFYKSLGFKQEDGVGYPQLSAVLECANAAHGLEGHIISDGGCTNSGDVCKAFGAGTDFVILGGMLSGHTECGGERVEKNGRIYQKFYGMSSSTAMIKHDGEVAEYRASEGKTVQVPYCGDVSKTCTDILGGLRSACTYTGSSKLKELPRRTTFISGIQQTNEIFRLAEVEDS